ncbi:MAG: DHA2 family efflux MFS transporter permease subunit [Burkholderiaceae bacterium]
MSSTDSAVPHRGMITISIMLATIMQTLDSTIANVALPHMQGTLSAASDQITWVLTSYIVAAAIATPATGWLADRFGRKNLFLLAVAGFTVTSALCGMSETLLQIVVARLLQGVFGAALVPLSQATLLDINPPHKQGPAMAVWGMGVMIGPIIGPTLGGWLTEDYNWRWVFYINLPIGAVAFFGILTFMRETARRADSRFDFFGFATLSLAIGLLQLFLDRGEQKDWLGSIEIRIEMIGSLIAAAFFIAHTATSGRDSFFDTRILRDRNYFTGLLVIFVTGLVLYATRALLPPMLQELMDYPVIATGLVLAPSGAGTMLAMLVAGRLVRQVDIRLIMTVGFLLTIFSLWQMTHYTLVLSESDIVWPGIIQGIGLGFIFVPLSTVTFSTLQAELRPAGTSIFSLSRNVGSSIGISVVETLLTRNTQVMHATLSEHVSIFNPLAMAGSQLMTPSGLAALDVEVTRQAAMIAYINDFRFMMILALLTMPLILLIKPLRLHAPEAGHLAID